MSEAVWPQCALPFWAILVASCSQTNDFGPSREAVKQQLRDPASAEFRNESIRTLWTKGGQRLTIYCGEVNATNAFGGKTGFKPVGHIIDHKNLSPNVRKLWEIGEVQIHTGGPSPNHYLNCIRQDTERNDADFGKAIAWFGEFDESDHAEVDRMEPVISNRTAP